MREVIIQRVGRIFEEGNFFKYFHQRGGGGGRLFEGGDYFKYFHQQGEDYLREAII